MKPPKHIAFAINDLRKTGKLAHADPLFCDGLARDGAACQIMAAAVQGDAERLLMLLSDPRVLPDFENAHGITPLMAAAARGHTAAVDLLAAQPLVNTGRATRDGWTALHYAAWFDESGAAKALIAHHAPLDAKTKSGASPLDLAGDKPVAEVFWANRDFARQMRQQNPEHPKFQPAAKIEPGPAPEPSSAAAAPETPAKTLPEKNESKDAFFRAILGVGLQWKTSPALDVKGALTGRLAAMKKDDLAEAYKTIRDTGAPFDWSAVFVKAAAASNLEAMRFLHNDLLFDQLTLNRALSAAVQAGDHRDAAHHLVIWGADPAAPFETGGQMKAPTIFEAAFRQERAGIFEELILWRGERLAKTDAQRLDAFAPRLDNHGFEMKKSLALYQKKREVKKMRAGNLKDLFNQAVTEGDITAIMAAYAEAREDRLFRGRVEFGRQDGGGAIAAALISGRCEFARRLIADGYHLKDAPGFMKSEVRLQAPEKAKTFAEEHLAGRLQVESVEDVGRARRSELRVIAAGPIIGGARYGMF
ncbi:MAG: ankyrin repeat domain-containing protein [Alphaproteobacteria bacterium]|nr:MAG: ankyrin repeat domain-containing protein [Alphaproteobacteria bacterium]